MTRASAPGAPSLLPAALILSLALSGCGTADPEKPTAESRAAAVTRTLRLEVKPGEQPIRIENLVGSFTVVPGSGETILAVVTVHASSDDLAGLVTFEESRGEEGETLLRVGYPVAEHGTYRYGDPEETGSNWLNLFGAGGSNTGFPYGDAQVHVSRTRGVDLWADVEVSLPGRDVSVSFLNGVGPMKARGVRGSLTFVTYSGDQSFEDLSGGLKCEVSSGTATITRQRGTLDCEMGSGRIEVDGFEGSDLVCTAHSGQLVVKGGSSQTIRLETASGDVSLEGSSARLLKASTASGDVAVDAARVEEFEAGTASGDISFTAGAEGLRTIKIGSAGGDVVLRLDPASSFEARADLGHGRFENGIEDAEPIREGGSLLGYKKGEGGVRIDVRTVHGDVRLAPRR